MFRRSRETMIALRARHQAFRIASDVGHPRIDVPPPPEPAIPVPPEVVPARHPVPVRPVYLIYADPADDEVTSPQPQSPVARVLTSDLVLSLLMILIGAGAIVLCKFG